jgi:hypothetical protein
MHEFDDIQMGNGEDPVERMQPVAEDDNLLGAADIARNPDLANAVHGLEKKTDFTEDDIDWKKVYEEDCEVATKLASDKKWNIYRLMSGEMETDTAWCFGCKFRQKGLKANGVFEHMNEYQNGNYGHVGMLTLLSGLQEIYITRQLKRMTAQRDEAKFWFRRALYDHVHEHNKTEYVSTIMRCKKYDILSREIWEKRIHRDVLTGATSMDYRALPHLVKMDDKGEALRAKIVKMKQNGIDRSF